MGRTNGRMWLYIHIDAYSPTGFGSMCIWNLFDVVVSKYFIHLINQTTKLGAV
jgi:hypothetical protein